MSSEKARVVFYVLGRRFLDEKKAPPETQQLIYYTLAIGHHIGTIDCFEEKLSIPLSKYESWISKLPAGEEARQKFEGLLKFGEIVIDSTHIHLLALALDKALGEMNEEEQGWSKKIIEFLHLIHEEPAIHIMVRRRDV